MGPRVSWRRSSSPAPSPRPASDVYAMAALGWFCLTGDPPAPATRLHSLTASRTELPGRWSRSSPPASPPTRRRGPLQARPRWRSSTRRRQSRCAWTRRQTQRLRSRAEFALPQSLLPPWQRRRRKRQRRPAGHRRRCPRHGCGARGRRHPGLAASAVRRSSESRLPRRRAGGRHPPSATDHDRCGDGAGLTADRGGRTAAGVGRRRGPSPTLRATPLCWIWSMPRAPPGADVDHGNIATALKKGGTYLGLAFVVKDVAFLEGTSDTARIRATHPDARLSDGTAGRSGRCRHAQDDRAGPQSSPLSLTPDGWRIRALTTVVATHPPGPVGKGGVVLAPDRWCGQEHRRLVSKRGEGVRDPRLRSSDQPAHGLSMVSWSKTNPDAVRTLGSTRWLPRMSPANSPMMALSAKAGRGQHRRAAQLRRRGPSWPRPDATAGGRRG